MWIHIYLDHGYYLNYVLTIYSNMFLLFSSDYRYNNNVASDQIASTTQAQQVSGFVPGWML